MSSTGAGTRDLTEGRVFHTLLVFSIPFMASNIMQTLYSMVDMMIVGNIVGQDGLSALSTGSTLMETMVVILIGFTSGGQVVIAQHLGSGQKEKVPNINGTLTILTLLISLAFMLAGLIGCDFFLTLLNTPDEAFAYAHDYVTIYSAGILFTGLYNMISAVFRAQGDSRHPLIFVTVATVINVVLDLLFVGVFRWAAAGAAFATIIGQAVSVIFSVVFLLRHQAEFHFRFAARFFCPDLPLMGKICRLGIPMALHSSTIQISFLFVSGMINALGVAASAAFGAMQKIRNLPGFVMNSFSMGANSMIGQNYGAGKYDRIREVVLSSFLLSGIVSAIAAAVLFLFPRPVFGLFTSDEEVLTYAAMCMLCIIIELPARSVMTGGLALINGIGNMPLSIVLGIVDAFLGRIGMTWLFGSCLGLGAFGCFLGYTLATYLSAVPQLIYFLSGIWTRRKRKI